MSAPHVPEEFRALIVQEDDTVCTALNNLTQLSVMVWRMVKYKYETDGSGITTAYGNLLNEIICPDPPVELTGEAVNPVDFKNVLLGHTSGFCEMFVKLAVQLSSLIYNWVAFEYTEDGTLTDEYKALICGLDCAEQEESQDLSYFLNYEGFEKWDVVQNSVDLVGVDPYDPWPGNGMYVDLNGTLDLDHVPQGPGAIRTKVGVAIVSGKEYRLRIDVAGLKYSEFTASCRVRVLLSDNTTAVLDETISRDWDDPFSTESFTFIAGVTDTVKIQVEQVGIIFGNVGIKIDDVIFENLTDGTTLFSDDFSQEGPIPAAVAAVVPPDPDTMKAAIPIASLTVCEKMEKILIDFPRAVYDVVNFEYDSSGVGFTDDYSLLVCEHVEHGGGTVTLPAPTGVSASDGGFTDRVRVTWGAVTPASGDVTNYRIYRAAEDVTDPTAATLLATVAGTLTSYDDTTAVSGTTYSYWVRAVQDAVLSGYSNRDTGYFTSTPLTATLEAVTDLQATQGYYPTTTGFIRLMWTMTEEANRVDVYRGTINDFDAATLVVENAPLLQNSGEPHADDIGQAYHQGNNEYIYWHEPPAGDVKYYFWVVPKKYTNPITPVEFADESNSVLGWVQIGTGDTNPTTPAIASVGNIVVPVGKTKMRVLMIGSGGSASDSAPSSSSSTLGAGGAAGDVVEALFTVNPGDTWVHSIPQARSGTGVYVSASPNDGPTSNTQYEGRASRLVGPGTEVIQAAGGLCAVYHAIGSIRGPANTGSETVITDITPAESNIFRGKAGMPFYEGGYGGYARGFNRPGNKAASTRNASDNDATEYSGSSACVNGALGGGNNGTPLLLYVFSD